MCHVGEVHSRWLGTRHVLLSLNPLSDWRDVGTGAESVPGRVAGGNAVDLGLDVVLARVSGEDVGAVFELVLLVAAAAQGDGCDDAVGHVARAGRDVHGVQHEAGAVVGGKTDKLRIHKHC